MYTIALFGESEKGQYHQPHFCDSLQQLIDHLGHPPQDSRGLYFAIQAILYHYNLIYFRVKEEGYSQDDYMKGTHLLRAHCNDLKISALFAPGVGNNDLIEEMALICELFQGVLIVNESDLYDYLTAAG